MGWNGPNTGDVEGRRRRAAEVLAAAQAVGTTARERKAEPPAETARSLGHRWGLMEDFVARFMALEKRVAVLEAAVAGVKPDPATGG